MRVPLPRHRSAPVVTPPTDRGVDFPVGLGWLGLTLRAHTDSGRAALISDILAAVGEDDPRERGPIRGYPEALGVLDESAIGWTDERPREVHLTLKQTDCTWWRFSNLLGV